MRVDQSRKSVDIEQRDVTYILQAFARSYLFVSRNEDPEVITFPMYSSIPHPIDPTKRIKIEYAPDMSEIAVDIAQDGSNVPEPTPESEAKADEDERVYIETKQQLDDIDAEATRIVEEATAEPAPEASSAIGGVGEQPSAERLAKVKLPDNPLPPGTPSDYGGRRDPRDTRRIARDLAPEKDIKEDEEIEDSSIVDRAKGQSGAAD